MESEEFYMRLEKAIREIAETLKIDMIGFTDRYESSHIRDLLLQRRESSGLIEFEPQDLDSRLYPERLMPDYKSIICIAMSYKSENSSGDRTKGLISKSAIGKDYHDVIEEKAVLLVQAISSLCEFNYYAGVDTTPLLDREIAKNSGIGYFGKNTNIINPDYGSFISIGYILTDLSLKSDSELDNDCGKCDICIKSCPTSALLGDYTMNPKKCVSYLTQTKLNIEYELREKMSLKFYGCDTCQDVCPKNKKIKWNKSTDSNLALNGIDLEKMVKITKSEFKEEFSSTAAGWRGRNIIRRNAIIAMGNSKDLKYTSILKELLQEKSEMIRKYALWSLMKLSISDASEYVAENRDCLNEKIKNEYYEILDYLKRRGLVAK